MANIGMMRLKKELAMLYKEPPPGISAWAKENGCSELEAVIRGAEDTPYAKGSFRLQLNIPQRYPFEPPKVQFVTPIYHPNIDSAGRICLDILNMPPKGAWKPSLNISTVLSSIQLLMSHPNADDGLMLDITHEYIHNFSKFQRSAAAHTRQHAMPGADKGQDGAAAADDGDTDGGERALSAAGASESSFSAQPAAVATGAPSCSLDAPEESGVSPKRPRLG